MASGSAIMTNFLKSSRSPPVKDQQKHGRRAGYTYFEVAKSHSITCPPCFYLESLGQLALARLGGTGGERRAIFRPLSIIPLSSLRIAELEAEVDAEFLEALLQAAVEFVL